MSWRSRFLPVLKLGLCSDLCENGDFLVKIYDFHQYTVESTYFFNYGKYSQCKNHLSKTPKRQISVTCRIWSRIAQKRSKNVILTPFLGPFFAPKWIFFGAYFGHRKCPEMVSIPSVLRRCLFESPVLHRTGFAKTGFCHFGVQNWSKLVKMDPSE
jgi:hypothetical protein